MGFGLLAYAIKYTFIYWPYLEVFLSSMVAYRFLPPYIYLVSRQTSFSVAPVADLPNTTAWGGGGYGFRKIIYTAIRPGVFGARGRNS